MQSGLFADCAVLLQDRPWYFQDPPFQDVGISHEGTLKKIRTARDVRQDFTREPSGAGFGKRNFPSFFSQEVTDYFRKSGGVQPEITVAEFLPYALLHFRNQLQRDCRGNNQNLYHVRLGKYRIWNPFLLHERMQVFFNR